MCKKEYYIDDFEKYLKENDKAGGTIKLYKDNLKLFVKYYMGTYGEEFTAEKVITMDLQDWRTYQINLGNKANTINNRMAAVKEYFSLLESEGIIEKSPARTIKKIKINNTSPLNKTFTEKEYKAIKRAIYKGLNLMDIMIMELFSKEGLRVSELTNLQLDDITSGERSGNLRVIGKGMKERNIPLHIDVRKAIVDYLPSRNKKGKTLPYLLINEKGNKFSRSGIYKRLLKYQHITGVEIHPHKFRSFFATQILKSNPINICQFLLGHESISTTQKYLSMEGIDITNAIDSLTDL
jgi:site-specific recombinase XerD